MPNTLFKQQEDRRQVNHARDYVTVLACLSVLISAAPAIGQVSAADKQHQPTLDTRGWVQTCALNKPSTLDGYAKLDHLAYLDRPDSIASRATSPFEESFTSKLVSGTIASPLSKTFCQIGVTRMVVDITYATQDDAISHVTTRAVYQWVTNEDATGWQIVELGERSICARGRNPNTKFCL